MLTSVALILIVGLALGWFLKRLGLPSLIGMILTGILLGPYVLNALDSSILLISNDLRQMALVIILFRAGLSLNVKDLKKVGLPALLMSCVPASFEIIAVIILAPLLFGLPLIDAALLGTVLAAVSPAVVVPSMLMVMDHGYGQDKKVPQLVLAGASLDDAFVIVLFTSFLSLAGGEAISISTLMSLPISIVSGILIGYAVGKGMHLFFSHFHMRDTLKVLILLSVSFFLLELEGLLTGILPTSSLLAIMAMGLTLKHVYSELADRLSIKYNKLWLGAQILLFVLVGATVNIPYALEAGLAVVLLIGLALIFRMLGVCLSLLPSELNGKEKLFVSFSYIPKATVQAAIGGIPLAVGLASGELILTVAVVAILLTAPIGAFAIEKSYRKLLQSPNGEGGY
ncbi:cation:proton antiporter [Alkalibacterium sp. MB6]|uniref:cation:proton antiporter n=1 Tax=Alkalibacterium sp. MB6 TaxID=2081965 RepID=UPI001379B830|nr:cation:proton antiporter [Alkalibacterium sp. MB6]